MQKHDRHESIRELRRAGHSVGDIAERQAVSRQTVWRACRGLEPVAPAPAPATPTNGNGHDLEAARDIGLGVLLDRARGGSVSAAGILFKQASAEIRAVQCVDHVAAEVVVKALHAQYELWRSNLKGAFVRRLLLEFDLDPGQVESLVHDAIDAVTTELNRRSESEAEDNQNHG